MRTSRLGKRELILGLKHSTLDGAFAQILLTVTIINGQFVVIFASQVLHFSDQWIGYLAALPFIAGILQPFGSAVASRWFNRKAICVGFPVVVALLWLVVVWLPLMPLPLFRGHAGKFFFVAAVVITVLTTLGSVSWTGWISDLVPKEIRGTFFGRRNTLCAAVAMATALMAGFYLDMFEGAKEQLPLAFAMLFTAAVLFRFVSLYYLNRIPDPGQTEQGGVQAMVAGVRVAFKDHNFMRFVWFSTSFGFFLNLVGPFSTFYMTDNLQISVGTIALLGCVTNVGTLIAMPAWGKLGDRFGFKPVMIVATLLWLAPPLAWIFTSRGNWHFISIVFFTCGLMSAGYVLAQFNLLLKLVPAEFKTAYISVFTFITCLGAAASPVIGGQLAAVMDIRNASLDAWHVTVLGRNIYGFHVLVILQLVPAMMSLVFLQRLREPAERSVVDVVGAMRGMREFNPILGFGFIVQRLFTPSSLKGVVQQGARAIHETRKVAREVGEDLAEDAVKLIKTSGKTPPEEKLPGQKTK